MKISILFSFVIIVLSKTVDCHEFPKAITLKLIYQLITGELLTSKQKDKNDSKMKNATSSYLGEITLFLSLSSILRNCDIVLDYFTCLDHHMCMLHEIYEADHKNNKKTKCELISSH